MDQFKFLYNRRLIEAITKRLCITSYRWDCFFNTSSTYYPQVTYKPNHSTALLVPTPLTQRDIPGNPYPRRIYATGVLRLDCYPVSYRTT